MAESTQVKDGMADDDTQLVSEIMDKLAVNFGAELTKIVPGRESLSAL